MALFYNNVAVDDLMEGEVVRAEQLLRYLIAELPHLKEARNNLGVVLMRQGRFAEALKVLQEAIALFPDYQPLYTNATQAAKGAGQPELAKSLEAQGKRFLEQDPFFIFNQGLALFQQKDQPGGPIAHEEGLEPAAQQPHALCLDRQSHLTAGEEEEGKEAFAHAQVWAPLLPFLSSMRLEFSALRDVPFSPGHNVLGAQPSPPWQPPPRELGVGY